MTKDEREQMMGEILEDGGTFQEAAEAAGVSDETARLTSKKLEVERPPKVKGKDGKMRRSSYRPRKPKTSTLFDPGEAVAAARSGRGGG